MLEEKEDFERSQGEAMRQLQSQLEAAQKQIRNLILKGEEMDEELNEAKKKGEGKIGLTVVSQDMFLLFASHSLQESRRETREGTRKAEHGTGRDEIDQRHLTESVTQEGEGS